MSLAGNQSLLEPEVAFLESLRPEYERRGYRFVIHPNESDLPDFLATYEPDAVARRPDHNVAIEIKTNGSPATEQSLQRIRKIFEGHPDWQFRVAYVGGDTRSVGILPVPSRNDVLVRANEVEALLLVGDRRAAFVSAWSLLEAALNSARPNAAKRPRTPGTVIQTAAMEGLITAEIDQSLRQLVDLRNRVVHGDLTANPSDSDVRQVLSAVRTVLS